MEEDIRIQEDGSQTTEISKLRSKIFNKQGQNYKFYCSFCDDKFLFESTWKRHLESHSRESSSTVLKCTFCPLSFNSEENLLNHKLKNHKKIISMHKCRMCIQRFDSVKELNLHCVTHFLSGKPKKDVYKCESCLKLFTSEFELKSHKSSKHELNICPCCKKEFLSRDFLIRHEVLHKNIDSSYSCLKCQESEKFMSPDEVSLHLIDKHGELDSPVCSECGRKFANYQLLDYHMRIHFGSKPYFCSKNGCKRFFGLKELFEVHQKAHEGEKPYQCCKCLKCFNRLELYKNHLKEHDKPKEKIPEPSREQEKQVWNCAKCPVIFDSVFDLHNHERKAHKGGNSCLLCSQKFSSKSALSVHLRRHLNLKRHSCSECGKKFTESNELTRHIFTHKDPKDRPHKCETCPKTFASSSELKVHQQTHQGKIFECKECDKKYSRKDLLRAHARDNHSEQDTRVSCLTCGKIFKNRRICNIHMKREHTNKLFECEKCSWITLSEAALKIHIKDRHLEIESGETSCEICNKIYANKKTLKDHQKRVHEAAGKFSCEICQNTFLTQYSLDIHSKIHKKETDKEFRCLKCVLIFNSEQEFENHQQIHFEENSIPKPSTKIDYRDKPLTCEICNKWCRGKWWLEVHMRSHTNDRPFKCPQENCEQAFRTNNALKNHQKIHTKEKFYKCTICSKSFAEKKSLKLHSFLHSGERPYECEICGRGFITNHFLKTHTFKHIKAGETKENFSEAKREMIRRQQEIKQVQAQLKHNVSDGLQINIDFSSIDDIIAEEQEEISQVPDTAEITENQDTEGTQAIEDIIEYDETVDLSEFIEISTAENPIIIEDTIIEEITENDIQEFKEDDIIVYEGQIENSQELNFAVETLEIPMIQQSRFVFRQNVCPYCKEVCQNSDELDQHINDQHVKERPHCCIICGYRFKVKSKLERHYKIHLNEKSFECDVCKMKFSESYSLKSHKALHTDNPKPYRCLCGTGFRNKTDLNSHKYTCHILKIQGLEIKDFENFDEAREFVKSQEIEFTLENCEICNNNYKCGYCEKSFHILQSLEFHLKVHQQESLLSQFSCDLCDYQTNNKWSLQKHIRLFHPENDTTEGILSKEEREELIPCHICSKTMARCRLDRHVKLVHPKTYYRCPQKNCRKLVNSIKKIAEHIRVHEEDNQIKEPKKNTILHQCQICSLVVSSIHSLKRHQARHFNERKFSCKICSERFFTKQTKMAHVVKNHGLKAAEIDANFIVG